MELSTWITGDARSGKTAKLVELFAMWLKADLGSAAILLATNHNTRRELTQRLIETVGGNYPVVVKTPLGFIEDEVILFAPLWWEKLHLKPQFTLRLRSETEQALATQLWHNAWPSNLIPNLKTESRLVRTTLDILQLAGASGTPLEDISSLLSSRLSPEETALFDEEGVFDLMEELIQQWCEWCLKRGFLTYGLIYYLYGQVLLADEIYQAKLKERFQGIFADDVDDYPAIVYDLARLVLEQNGRGVFTFNPNGKVRLGMNADPEVWEKLVSVSKIVPVASFSSSSPMIESPSNRVQEVLQMVEAPSGFEPLAPCFLNLQTTSRSQLLRSTANVIINAVQSGKIAPEEIAIIVPGLDEIARYTFLRLFSGHSIEANPLNEQRPLISSSLVRALLTLACLVYPRLGRLLNPQDVAEMLVILTQYSTYKIDSVRAGLITDYCFQPDLFSPFLIDIKVFPRWDRVGYQSKTAYDELRHWIEKQKEKQSSLLSFFNAAIQRFLWRGKNLSLADLASLRALTETTQHYWEVEERKQQQENKTIEQSSVIKALILLLRQGTITANPYPLSAFQVSPDATGITVANIFQYRSQRMSHRWQFWFDIGSPLWEKTGASRLFAYSAFLREGNTDLEEEENLKRVLNDLLLRTTERIYLCHSDLAINGTEQSGILLNLVQGSQSIESEI